MISNPFYQKIAKNTKNRRTHICVGLDPDLAKLPSSIPQTLEGLSEFLNVVVEVTRDICIAYKPNISFFESLGLDGLRLLETVCSRIPSDVPIILDAKRGDIGNTAKMQARYIFDYFGADATTLAPYMGLDSLAPFFDYKDKFSFVLGLTSNPGASDFETLAMKDGRPFYQIVSEKCATWMESYGNIGLVVGATQRAMEDLRAVEKRLLYLIPGVGAQGGSYEDAVRFGRNIDDLALINVTRGVIYASAEKDYAEAVRNALLTYCRPEGF